MVLRTLGHWPGNKPDLTRSPSNEPSAEPSQHPTAFPTHVPSTVPTDTPTELPTIAPTGSPSELPTELPTALPTYPPSNMPTGCLVIGAKMHVLFKENVAGRRLLAKMGVFYAQTNILQLVTTCSDCPYPLFRLSVLRIPVIRTPDSDCMYPLFRVAVHPHSDLGRGFRA